MDPLVVALGAVVVALLSIFLALLAMVYVALKELRKPQVIVLPQSYTTESSPVQHQSVEKPQEAKPVEKEKMAIEGSTFPASVQVHVPSAIAHCGHCGQEIFREAVEAVDVGGVAYLAFECPSCQRRTLLTSEETGSQDT